MQIHRLFEIVYVLLDKKKVTAKELACRFEVSERTIYRDVEVLSSAGIPRHTGSRGKGAASAWWRILSSTKSLLSEEEQRKFSMPSNPWEAVGGTGEVTGSLSRLGTLFQKGGGRLDRRGLLPHWGSDTEEKERFFSAENRPAGAWALPLTITAPMGENPAV